MTNLSKERLKGLEQSQELFENQQGYVIYKADEDYCEICMIELDNAEKNKGYGTNLLESFIETMVNNNITEFYLDACVTTDGIYDIEVLSKFYNKFGFMEIDRMLEEDRVIISMTLEVKNSKAS